MHRRVAHRRFVAVAASLVVIGSFLVGGSATAQVPVPPSIVADAECSPDGATQGVVFTFINGNVTAVTITSASVSGTALPGTVPLSFDPTDLLVEETATADIALAGTISGSLEVSVSWVGDNETEGEATAGFDVTPCAPTTTEPVTTSTAAPAAAAEATATFTG
jgi:hypothetical protein